MPKYQLNDNLGLIDARKCNDDFGSALPVGDPTKLRRGETIDLTPKAAEWLSSRYPALLDARVKGEAKEPEIKGQR